MWKRPQKGMRMQVKGNTIMDRFCETVDKLQKKTICDFQDLLLAVERGHRPDYQLILEEISLIDIYERGLPMPKMEYYLQYYLNKRWLTTIQF